MTECERLIQNGTVNESFLNEEVRCDYVVSEKIKKVWAIELDLVKHISDICEKNNLRYWVAYGTLLGTIRHKGYIPWDDDFDLFMPRPDYEKFIDIASKELSEPYFLQTTLNDDDYYSAFARVRNSNTTGVLVSKDNKCNNGIYIDIYPLDGLCKNLKLQKIRTFVVHVNNILAHAYAYNINPSIVTRTLHKVLHIEWLHYDLKKAYKFANFVAKQIPFDKANKVGVAVFPDSFKYEADWFNRADFEETLYMPYEYMNVPVPKGYDHILRDSYGNYMEFPPVEERGTWHNFIFEPDIPYKEWRK